MRYVIPILVAATLLSGLATYLMQSEGLAVLTLWLLLLTLALTALYALTRFVAWAVRR